VYIILGILFLLWTITVTRNTPDSYKIFFPILPNWQDDDRLAAVRLGTSTCKHTQPGFSAVMLPFFFARWTNSYLSWHVLMPRRHYGITWTNGGECSVFWGIKKCEKNIFRGIFSFKLFSKKKQEGGKTISWLQTRQYSVASRTQSTPPLRIARKSSYIFSNSFRNSSSIFTLMSKSYLLLN
jgi:hypothetical protein